jgi:hypothetical protein
MDSGNGLGFTIIGSTGSSSTLTFTIDNLTPGQPYFYIINAINIVGISPDSNSTQILAGLVP